MVSADIRSFCDGNYMQHSRKEDGDFLLLVGLLEQLTDRCKKVYNPNARQKRWCRKSSKKNAVSYSYCLWRDCAYTPTRQAGKTIKPTDRNRNGSKLSIKEASNQMLM